MKLPTIIATAIQRQWPDPGSRYSREYGVRAIAEVLRALGTDPAAAVELCSWADSSEEARDVSKAG